MAQSEEGRSHVSPREERAGGGKGDVPGGKRCLSPLRAVRKADAEAESGVEGQSVWSNFSKPALDVCVRAREPVRGGREVTFWWGWEDEPRSGLSFPPPRLLQ